MKINRRQLKQIINEEIAKLQREGMLDSALDSQLNPLKGMIDQRPAPPMVAGGKLGKTFRDPKLVFDSLRERFPFIQVNDSFAFIPDWVNDIGPGGMEGDGPIVEISYSIEGLAIKEVDVDVPEPGTRFYFIHRGR